ncbi:hypothetical protein MKY41_10455 [Sporosarcina sp. FSL W7-1349]|uniref:hypothetical protein n=1 Tax=Sporosarcina sp. FSL W7-1349 TaxID=2921561 RepID=UPI0030F5099C
MNLFQMKSRPHGKERLPLFLTDGFVAIGWPGVGDLSQADAEEIETRLAKTYTSYVGQKMAYYKGVVNTFVNVMEPDDYVMVAEGDYVHIGVLGDYIYRADYDNEEGMCHQRPVDWVITVERTKLNEKVQEHLRNRATVTKFKYPFQLAELEQVLKVNTLSDTKQIKDPLVDKAWNIAEKELDSEDPLIRIIAASVILQLRNNP